MNLQISLSNKNVDTTKAPYFSNNRMFSGNDIPTSGDYNVGDFIVSNKQEDNIFGWVCIEAGSPGIWQIIHGENVSGDKAFEPIFNVVNFSNSTSSIEIGIDSFNPNSDLLEVHYNGLMLMEGTHFNISADGKRIEVIGDPWNEDSETNHEIIFKVFKGNVPAQVVNNVVARVKQNIVINEEVSEVEIGVLGYSQRNDMLTVYKNSVYLIEGVDYSISGNKIICLNGTWNSENVETHFTFELLKNAAVIPEDTLVSMENLNDDVLQAIENAKGNIDLSGYATKEEVSSIQTDISGKQNAIDNNLDTRDKTIVGAINEIQNAYATAEYVDTNIAAEVGNRKELLTTEKGDIVGAINELFQTGNNVKQKLVDALIAKNYPVSTSNSWDELVSIVSNNLKLIIACTEIQTNKSSINITELPNSEDTYTVNYTLIPSNTTESIKYLMDDSYIAIVGSHNSSGNTGTLKIRPRKNGETNLKLTTMQQEVNIPINVDINITYAINVSGDYYVYFDDGETDSISGTSTTTFTKPYTNRYFNMYVRGLNNEDLSEEDVEIKVIGDYGNGPVDLSNNIEFDSGEFSYYIWNDCHLNIEIQEVNKIVNPAIMRGAAVGSSFSLILDNGYLYGAGYNGYGQLGQGNSTSNDDWYFVKNNLIESSIPRGEIAQIACGRYFSAILKTDGTIWTTGDNEGYATGHTDRKLSFTKVEGISNVKQISCGSNFMMAVKHDGTLWACGSNSNYQLGLGSSGNVSTFTQVTNMISNDVKQVACGGEHVLVLKTDGTLWACGSNAYGQYGNGDSPHRDGNYGVFLEIDTGKTISFIACGSDCSFFVTTGRRMYSAGLNDCGQLGTGDFSNKTTFTLVNSISEITAIESSYSTTYVISSGRAYSVGGNEYGQLGIGNTTNKQFFQSLADDVTLASASPDAEHMIIFNNSTHYACGSGSSGCLGGAGEYGQNYSWFGQVTLQ